MAIDAMTVQEAGSTGAEDLIQLDYATQHGRVTVSQDIDFLVLHDKGVEHTGIVYAPQQTPVGSMVRWLTLLHEVIDAEEMIGRVEFI